MDNAGAPLYLGTVQKLLGWIGAIAGGALGWWVGAQLGFFTAFLVSVVGTGMGIYGGRRLAARIF